MMLLVDFGAELVVPISYQLRLLLKALCYLSFEVFDVLLNGGVLPLSCGILHPLFFALLQEDIATRLHRRPQFKLSNRGLRHT